MDKKYIVKVVGKHLDGQFESYSLCDMIDDIDEEVLTDVQKQWAKEHIEWGLKVTGC